MERSQVLDAMSQLKLYGMKAAYDEIITTAVKRQHEPQQIVGDLLNAEISEKQARSIKYQITIAKLPSAKEIEEFSFEETPINETLMRDLMTGAFLEQQRNLVLIGGTGFRCVGIVEALERDLGRPVVSANQASLWRTLRLSGVAAKVEGYGRLLAL